MVVMLTVGVNCNYQAVCDVWSKLIGVTTY